MSDEYGQIGPDKPGYADDVHRIRDRLGRPQRLGVGMGEAVAFPFAANLTKKHVVLVLLSSCEQLSRPEGFASQDALFVGIADGQSAWLPTDSWLHPAYVGQYLGHPWGWYDTSDVNSEPFARFLNDVLGHASPAVPHG